MSGPLFDYYWPCLVVGLVAGLLAGIIIARRGLAGRARAGAVAIALAAALGGVGLWSGPLGGADRLVAAIEQPVRALLVHYEMTQVTAQLERHPLSRQLFLRGPADDLQRSELVRMTEELPGVAEARWNHRGHPVPVILEAFAIAGLGLLLGLFLAYLVELRRRENEKWSW